MALDSSCADRSPGTFHTLVADPVVRAQQKRELVLRFLRDEIWTCTEVVGLLLGVTYPAAHLLMKRLAAGGHTQFRAMFVPGTRGAKRVVLHGITAQGLAFAWGADEEIEARNPWEPSKTNALFVNHQIEAQLARLRAEQLGWSNWQPARVLMKQGLMKIPDAQAVDAEGTRVAVEIEREIKTGKRYETIIGAYVASMKSTDLRWQRVDYLCPDADFAARLARAFGLLKHIRLEVAGMPSRTGDLTQAHLNRFRFYAAKEWPGGPFLVAKVAGSGGQVTA